MERSSDSELSVLSASIQQLYGLYLADRFRVNRRYQRKLVWSVEEKQKLIDSIMRKLPIPLFLVAEIGSLGDVSYELIDGMQRLNAIFSFLENEYPVGGEFFDLDALADTKFQKDEGPLNQQTPAMPREASVQLSNYTIALSVYRARSSASVDEVFRRVNSGGRRLSSQELRQAGTTSRLADQVRIISSRIRTDTSPGDVVPLRLMPKLSISNRNLDYGVLVDNIFWVQQGILRREDVRQSLDEQLILDLLIDCLIEPIPNSGPPIRNEYYSFSDDSSNDKPTRASLVIESAIEAYEPARLEEDFMHIYDVIREIANQQDRKLSSLIGAGAAGRSGRYFHSVFMAIFELMIKDGMRARDYTLAATKLTEMASSRPLSIPAGGGDWRKDAKRVSIDTVKGVLRDAFEETGDGEDLGRYGWASQLETILSNALVEQQLFDHKQGFLSLDSKRPFDEDNFTKICRTLTAMANAGPASTGYVAIGIADKHSAASRIQELDGIEPIVYRDFRIVGIEREANQRGQSLNEYWHWLMQRMHSGPLDRQLANYIATASRLVHYHGRSVALLKTRGQSTPLPFNGVTVDRVGSETIDVSQDQSQHLFNIYSRFMQP